MKLREWEALPGFIIGCYNLNNIRCVDDTVLMADLEGKLKELLVNVVKSKHKRLLTVRREAALSPVKGNLRCELCNVNIKMKHRNLTIWIE